MDRKSREPDRKGPEYSPCVDLKSTEFKPLNLGKTLRPLTSRDDILGEMLS